MYSYFWGSSPFGAQPKTWRQVVQEDVPISADFGRWDSAVLSRWNDSWTNEVYRMNMDHIYINGISNFHIYHNM